MSSKKTIEVILNELDSKADAIKKLVKEARTKLSLENKEVLSENDTSVQENVVETRKESTDVKKVLTLEDVRPVLAGISRAGFTAGVKSLLQKYGANKLSEIKPEDYESLLKDAEVLANGS